MIYGGSQAGPSGSNGLQWQGFLLHYEAHSERLCDSMAELARQLSKPIVEWTDIHALVASHLIALDKCPGIIPNGIVEDPAGFWEKCLLLPPDMKLWMFSMFLSFAQV